MYVYTKVALCLPGVQYEEIFWFTRYSNFNKIFINNLPDYPQVPQTSVTLAEPAKADDPHLLGLDPGLPGHCGAVLQCRQSGGQEVDGDEAGEY